MTTTTTPTLDRLAVRSLADASGDDAVAALRAGFAGYLIPFSMTRPQYEARFRGEHLDPFASYIWTFDDDPVAVLLITRRGWRSRVAAVGVSPGMRGTGLGSATMARAVAEARARGDTRLVLEVFESNLAAMKLYRRAGFVATQRLWGFAIEVDHGVSADATPLREIDPAVGAVHAARFQRGDLPWQLEPATLAATIRPARCVVDATESIVGIVDTSQDRLRLRAVAFDPDITPADAQAFTASLGAMSPQRAWTAPQIFPDRHRTRFFEPAGWTAAELSQCEMRHDLGDG